MKVWRHRVAGRRSDRGSGTVLLLALVAVALVVATLLGLLASAQLGRGRAQTAADLGALAGAARLLAGQPGDPCPTAAEVVRRNGARLSSCTDEGAGVVTVRVLVRGAAGSATASARAGPTSARR
ncbi:Rv3654c family TadE-like protein [Cellulomonas humilata]|uniref:Secretion/DNA translocation related TadE-like protein n=1 Tax=Cellulomonas humilata TaxID=144055 RepID=A0ABU0EK34_9CELL|nr:Rv3654c family TadE-like protein [Cellulomonas humilata]MDQ0375172.1 secretion/DNA translocation related TadE-like protein [Cellulomonas humilata]